MTPLLTVTDLQLSFKNKQVFKNLSLTIEPHKKIGLVGLNGTGKTTLMKILAGVLEADYVEINKLQDLKISYLPQDFPLPAEQTAREYLLPDIAKDGEAYLEQEAKILKLFGKFSLNQLDIPLGKLSGGQQRQVLLLKTLTEDADLILLDEPTNHLDLETMEALKDLILDFSGTVVLICHDRYFIDQVADSIWELDSGKIHIHPGNYSDYLNSKDERYQIALKKYNKRHQELKRELEWVRSGVKARGTKDQGRLNRYYELEEVHKGSKPKHDKPYLPIPKIKPLGKKILITEELSVKLPGENNYNLIENFNIEFQEGMKIGILGPNGSGKTTLIKSLLGDHKKDFGKIIIGQNTDFNYQDQKRLDLDDKSTIMYTLSEGNIRIKFGDGSMNIYAYLKKFLFHPDDLKQPVSTLSGGQRARLLLAKILKLGGNFLILDEPTNDLDLDTLQALENSLIEFPGCVLLVSHDRFFLDRVCTHILALEGDGLYTLSTGGYTDYLHKYGSASKYYSQFVPKKNSLEVKYEEIDKPLETPSEKSANPKEERKKKADLRNLEKSIEQIQQEIIELEMMYADPEFFTQPKSKIGGFHKKLAMKREELSALETQWIELSDA